MGTSNEYLPAKWWNVMMCRYSCPPEHARIQPLALGPQPSSPYLSMAACHHSSAARSIRVQLSAPARGVRHYQFPTREFVHTSPSREVRTCPHGSGREIS